MPTPTSGTAPVLDGPPASPDAVQATQPSQEQFLASLAPQQVAGAANASMQVAEITMKTTQALIEGFNLLGQIHPEAGPLMNDLILRLRTGMTQVLEQGLAPSEPSPNGMQGTMGALAPMTSGMPGMEEGSPAGPPMQPQPGY